MSARSPDQCLEKQTELYRSHISKRGFDPKEHPMQPNNVGPGAGLVATAANSADLEVKDAQLIFGAAWREARLDAILEVRRNGDVFGAVPSNEMEFGFHDLLAHAARTRAVCSGTIVGSGTVSTSRFRDAGSCCISERRAIEMIDFSAPRTGFLKFGERVSMETHVAGHAVSPFGRLDQRIVKSP